LGYCGNATINVIISDNIMVFVADDPSIADILHTIQAQDSFLEEGIIADERQELLLGECSLERGHSLVPEPPARTTGMMIMSSNL
jgi:hypothetical protein